MRKIYKVVFITTSLGLGGAEKIFYEIIKEFNNREILVVSLGEIDFFNDKLNNLGIKVEYLGLKNNLFSLIKFFKLINILNRNRGGIIHTWLYKANLFGGIAAKISGNSNIYWSIHHDLENEQKSFIRYLFMLILSFLSNTIPKKIIYCSESSANNHIKFGFNRTKAIVINNGIDINNFQKDNYKYKEFRENILNIKKDTFLIGNIGRYHPIKDHKTLFKALSIIKYKNINFKCILAGENLDYKNKDLFNQICKLGLKNNIILMGKINDIREILCSLDLLVISSLSECSPMILLEAMSSEVLCISSDVGNIKNIMKSSKFLFKKSNHNQLANKILFTIKNRNKLTKHLKDSKSNIIKNYSLENMLSQYSKLYNL